MGPDVKEVSDDDDNAAMEAFSAGRTALGQKNFDGAFGEIAFL
jgi:hypothetical protein